MTNHFPDSIGRAASAGLRTIHFGLFLLCYLASCTSPRSEPEPSSAPGQREPAGKPDGSSRSPISPGQPGGGEGEGGRGGTDGPVAGDQDATGGPPAPPKALELGQSCTGAAECASGFCVERVCCAAECLGLCQSCLSANTSLPDGSCGPVRAGFDPNGQCEKSPEACGLDGECDGAGACRNQGKDVVCATETCAGGMYTPPRQCDGSGHCGPVSQPVACGPYPCENQRCRMTCAANGECASGNFCDNGICAAKKESGRSCTGAAECMSGFCADGVCCQDSCTGPCQACSRAKNDQQDGRCLPVPEASDPDSDCSETARSSCGNDGFCDGRGACRKWSSSTVCREASCSGGNEIGAARCDGRGRCGSGAERSCRGLRCQNDQCLSTCSDAGSCQRSGQVCTADRRGCRDPIAPGQGCSSGDTCRGALVCARNGKCCDDANCSGGNTCSTRDGHCGRPKGENCDRDEQADNDLCASRDCREFGTCNGDAGRLCTSDSGCQPVRNCDLFPTDLCGTCNFSIRTFECQ